MAHKDFNSKERFTDINLGFRPAGWPKIDLHADTKEDLFRSFSLFDMNGLGAVSVDSVKVNDAAQELKDIYEDRQDKTRLRKGQGYATSVRVGDEVGGVETGPLVVLPATGMHRRTSSENAYDPTGLTVDFDKFKRILQLEVAPPEPI